MTTLFQNLNSQNKKQHIYKQKIFQLKKNILLLLILFSISTIVSAQKYRFETTGVSMSIISDKGKWSDYTKFKEAKIVVTFDSNKDRITIYSEILQFFKIVNYKNKITAKDGTEIESFECKDQEGVACLLSIYTYKNKDPKNRLYVNFRDRIFVYDMNYKP